jgi:hypothetical protein
LTKVSGGDQAGNAWHRSEEQAARDLAVQQRFGDQPGNEADQDGTKSGASWGDTRCEGRWCLRCE